MIAVDLDEILSETLSSVLEYYNTIHHSLFKRADFTSYNYWEIWGGTKNDEVEFIKNFYKTDFVKNTKPVAGAYEALLELKKLGYQFCIITGRSDVYKEQTLEWINQCYPNIFSDTFFANTFKLDKSTRKKSDICKSLNIKILIEDDSFHIADCTSEGITVLVLDCPWNKSANYENSIRLYSWEEISKNIQLLSKDK